MSHVRLGWQHASRSEMTSSPIIVYVTIVNAPVRTQMWRAGIVLLVRTFNTCTPEWAVSVNTPRVFEWAEALHNRTDIVLKP